MNIKPNPSFTPTPGRPRAASAHWPYAHRSLGEIQAEQIAERERQWRDELGLRSGER